MSDEQVVEQIDVIQDELSVYGYRRVTRALQAQGYDIHHKRVARIMRQQSLGIQPKRRFVRTTDSQHDGAHMPPIYIATGCQISQTESGGGYHNIRIETGFVYLAVIFGC
ncbi:IS3 family transposase [Candidatus Glomeribacter gigasporarum]|uniref:IS3 family transposase n=1 Tax=Candidatus Glomeribacter gigasporarum TaxID=132144 RepID=UPI000679D2DA|nr:IS3 family transposase [Candidatus Glomeribacter gigasporarum]